MDKHLIWAITLFLIVCSLCYTLIYINENSWTIRFEMDNNTKDAIESVDWESEIYRTDTVNDTVTHTVKSEVSDGL